MLASFDLKDREFKKFSSIIYDACRINLHDGKKELVQARLAKRLRKLQLSNFREYLKLVESDKEEFTIMVDSLSTNLTTFFREPAHFDFLRKEVFPVFQAERAKKIRLWSAGCSSGEEAYTLAILIKEYFEKVNLMDCLILATDISTRMLEKARNGIYSENRFKNVTTDIQNKYFIKVENDDSSLYRIRPELERLVRFKYLNLMAPWPIKGKFDVIFCRNVMIYFDKKTQEELISRFYEFLKPSGIFIVGHSESLVGVRHRFDYVKPTIYMKN